MGTGASLATQDVPRERHAWGRSDLTFPSRRGRSLTVPPRPWPQAAVSSLAADLALWTSLCDRFSAGDSGGRDALQLRVKPSQKRPTTIAFLLLPG